MWYIIIIIAVVALVIYSFRRKDDDVVVVEEQSKYPEKLLDLDTTTLAERQHAYGRGFREQQRYDKLQRMAEAAGDTYVLELIRTNTYNGILPELDDDNPPSQREEKSAKEPKVKNLRYFCIKDKGYHVSVWAKDAGMQNLDYIEFPIAGITHREKIDNYLGECVGTLEEEPDNQYDANAIKILADDGHHLGYVPRGYIFDVRKFTSLPCKCYVYIGENDGVYFSDCYIKSE